LEVIGASGHARNVLPDRQRTTLESINMSIAKRCTNRRLPLLSVSTTVCV